MTVLKDNRARMRSISTVVKDFESITLAEMDSVKLMNRIDTKYVVAASRLPGILDEVKDKYRILEIDQKRELEYRTTYYDTPDYAMYTAHQNGKLNRFKIRTREYVVSKIHFLEVKFKNNKGRTLKERVKRIDGDLGFQENEADFLADSAPYSVDDLIPKLWNRFTRLTLVHKTAQERLTIDFDLSFSNEKAESVDVPQLSIIEVKQDKYTSDSDIIKVLRKKHINEMRVSKYCIGTAMLTPWIKKNRFKVKLLAIGKLN